MRRHQDMEESGSPSVMSGTPEAVPLITLGDPGIRWIFFRKGSIVVGMDPTTAVLIYKLLNTGVATFLAWMGYRLFSLGVFQSSGDIDATFRDNRLILKRAAPGTLFLMFGTIVMIACIWRGFDSIVTQGTETSQSTTVTHASGFSGPNDAVRMVRLAQAINTLAAGETGQQRQPEQRLALQMLREWREEMAQSYLKQADIIMFYREQYDSYVTNPRLFQKEDGQKLQAAHDWLGRTLSEEYSK